MAKAMRNVCEPGTGLLLDGWVENAGLLQAPAMEMVATLLLMGIGTFLIGCLPGTESIGLLAAVLLTVLRIAHAFENATRARRPPSHLRPSQNR